MRFGVCPAGMCAWRAGAASRQQFGLSGIRGDTDQGMWWILFVMPINGSFHHVQGVQGGPWLGPGLPACSLELAKCSDGTGKAGVRTCRSGWASIFGTEQQVVSSAAATGSRGVWPANRRRNCVGPGRNRIPAIRLPQRRECTSRQGLRAKSVCRRSTVNGVHANESELSQGEQEPVDDNTSPEANIRVRPLQHRASSQEFNFRTGSARLCPLPPRPPRCVLRGSGRWPWPSRPGAHR